MVKKTSPASNERPAVFVPKEIQDGEFAKEWILENRANTPTFQAMRRRDHDCKLEQVGLADLARAERELLQAAFPEFSEP